MIKFDIENKKTLKQIRQSINELIIDYTLTADSQKEKCLEIQNQLSRLIYELGEYKVLVELPLEVELKREQDMLEYAKEFR